VPGYPGDPAIIVAVIQGAGGPARCHVPVVTLGSSAYQAVESHQVGFSAFFFSDVIQAEVQQHARLRVFNENNYGIPDQYAALILGNDAWLAANPSLAHKFVHALVRARVVSLRRR
jgi:ABC-type nitrate/sulfonate/bicarbonate transport system substrate-binding protein